MVCVRKRVIDNLPSLGVAHLLDIDQDAEQLDRSDGRMGIVELDLVFLSKFRPVVAMLDLVPAYNILDRRRAEEVLLLEP